MKHLQNLPGGTVLQILLLDLLTNPSKQEQIQKGWDEGNNFIKQHGEQFEKEQAEKDRKESARRISRSGTTTS